MKKLKNYSAGLFSLLLELISRYELSADQTVLHKIRIILKRIRSLFRLINFCDNSFDNKKEFNPLKNIFKAAGRIRNIFISGKLVSKYDLDVNLSIKEFEHDKELDLISAFRKNTVKFQKAIYRKYFRTEKFIERVTKNCFSDYFNHKFRELKNLVYPLLVDSELHRARKICKEITFLFDTGLKINTGNYHFFDNLQEQIGLWHDKKVLLDLMKEKNLKPASEKIEELESAIKQDKSKIKMLVSDFFRDE